VEETAKIPVAPTALGQCVLELIRLYHTEMKTSLTLQAMMQDGQSTVSGIGLRSIEAENNQAVGPKFALAEEQLLQGTEPLNVLRAFLAPR
jgi:hypothetical protein